MRRVRESPRAEECRLSAASRPIQTANDETPEAFLTHVALFAMLAQHERQAVVDVCRPRTFRAKEVLFHEGDPGQVMYLLRSGRVKIVLVGPDGAETILHILGPGEWVGEMALLDGEPRSATAVAMEPVE